MRFRTSIFVLVLALQSCANAQNSLDPCGDDFSDAYYNGVVKRIDDAVARKSSLQVTTFPSFQVESGLRLVGSEIYYVEFQNQFWNESTVWDGKGNGHMDFSKPKGTAKARHAPLETSLAARILRLYSKAIAQAAPSNRRGLDGTSYVFSTPDGACGRTWSPEPETHAGQLIELARRLETHTKFSTPNDLHRSEKAIVRYLNTIERNGARP